MDLVNIIAVAILIEALVEYGKRLSSIALTAKIIKHSGLSLPVSYWALL